MDRRTFDFARALFWSSVVLLGLGGGPFVVVAIAESIGLLPNTDALGLVCLAVVAMPLGVLCLFFGVALGGPPWSSRD